MYEKNLHRRPANHVPLTPLSFLPRAAAVYGQKTAVIYEQTSYNYTTLYIRCRKLASSLKDVGVSQNDTVSVLAPNVPAMLEAHFAVPMCGAILNTINVRLDATTVAFILAHSEAKVLIVDRQFSALATEALAQMTETLPLVVCIEDEEVIQDRSNLKDFMLYEDFLLRGNEAFDWKTPDDEWQAISLNYTSGTTGNPKGVVYHHRGAYLNAFGNIMALQMNTETRYLWTLPMFHCNGWCHPWALAAIGATQICIRKTEPASIFSAISRHRITHMCGAPVVLNMLVHASDKVKIAFDHEVQVATGGASPPSTVILSMAKIGFRVHHLYGLTETFGPATLSEWQEDWEKLEEQVQAERIARQGVAMPTLETVRVCHPDSLQDVPQDAQTIGEIMVRGNTVMKGYLKNSKATEEAFKEGWFRSGDLGVVHKDGYIEVKDRSKDIIISGGENISTIEIEEILYRHPAIMEAAVVSCPNEKWGEVPCAFVCLIPSANTITSQDIIQYCRDKLAHFKAPKKVVFGELPKTSTGKVQKYLLRERAAVL